MDMRAAGDGEGKLEADVARMLALNKRTQKAIFGYARVDLIEQKEEFRFGTWNERRLQGPQVASLVQSFLTKGADRFSLSKAIPLVVMKTDVKATTYATTFSPGMEAAMALPILELQEGAKGKRRLVAAGGQHRVHAVEAWTKHLRKQHGELVKQRQALEQQDTENVTAMEIENENQTRKPKRDALQETLGLGGQWMVVLYDSGERAFSRIESD